MKADKKAEMLKFNAFLKSFYTNNKRIMPWRDIDDSYKILVSEVMLQQTQVSRVMTKYEEFLNEFPTIEHLAKSSLSKLLIVWKGLGYNRRAVNLQRLAQEVVKNFNSKIPSSYEELLALPGIGQSTAGALSAFAFNKPVIFIETNIRTVFINHFFQNKEKVYDKELLPLIEKALDTKNPRDWYYALYDYGTYLKKEKGNVSRKSSTYKKQSKFEGSLRQARAKVLHHLASGKVETPKMLSSILSIDQKRIDIIIKAFQNEGIVKKTSKNNEIKLVN